MEQYHKDHPLRGTGLLCVGSHGDGKNRKSCLACGTEKEKGVFVGMSYLVLYHKATLLEPSKLADLLVEYLLPFVTHLGSEVHCTNVAVGAYLKCPDTVKENSPKRIALLAEGIHEHMALAVMLLLVGGKSGISAENLTKVRDLWKSKEPLGVSGTQGRLTSDETPWSTWNNLGPKTQMMSLIEHQSLLSAAEEDDPEENALV